MQPFQRWRCRRRMVRRCGSTNSGSDGPLLLSPHRSPRRGASARLERHPGRPRMHPGGLRLSRHACAVHGARRAGPRAQHPGQRLPARDGGAPPPAVPRPQRRAAGADARAGLPTFETSGMTLLKRLTLVIDDGKITARLLSRLSAGRTRRGGAGLASQRLSGALADSEQSVFWLDSPAAPEPLPPLEGETGCDLAIVGGGFTGLWAALLAAPDESVVLLEGDRCGWGASGRNGGFVEASLTTGSRTACRDGRTRSTRSCGSGARTSPRSARRSTPAASMPPGMRPA